MRMQKPACGSARKLRPTLDMKDIAVGKVWEHEGRLAIGQNVSERVEVAVAYIVRPPQAVT